MTDSITTFAPGKVLLLGEHSVVYGHLAIVLPITLGVTATLRPGAPKIIAPSLGVSFAPDEERADARQLDKALRALFAVTGPLQGELTLTGSLPFSRGLGSSAAVAVATARALWMRAGRAASINELESAVMQSERVLHKNPSGADAAASIRERCILFRRGTPPQIEVLSFASPFSITLVDTGERSSTATLVAGIAARREQSPEAVDATMGALGVLSLQAAAELQRGELEKAGAAMSRAHALLSSLGLSTPQLERAVAAAKEAGALGAKLTGAGGGGCVVALSSPDDTQRIRQHLRSVGLSVLDADVLPSALFA